MKKETDLAIRMKNYEERQDFKLITKMPVVVRIDGRAFHTFTIKGGKPTPLGVGVSEK